MIAFVVFNPCIEDAIDAKEEVYHFTLQTAIIFALYFTSVWRGGAMLRFALIALFSYGAKTQLNERIYFRLERRSPPLFVQWQSLNGRLFAEVFQIKI